MNTGALIVAAGAGSESDEIIQLKQLGSITTAERIIATLRQSGINRIVVVTGFHASELERLLSSLNIIFIRNASYDHSEMLDSVKLGLSYLKDKADRILFTPADVSLFTSDTVRKLLRSEHALTIPRFEGQSGHPILIQASLVDQLLAYHGNGGLRGAFADLSINPAYVSVTDPGILDTREQELVCRLKELLLIHNNDLIRPDLTIELSGEKPFFNEQVCTLLSLIDETENVREASSHMHISYTTAWNLIHRLEQELRCELVTRIQGGSGGSRSALTPYGKEIVRLYLSYTTELREEAGRLFEKHFGDFFQEK